MSKRNNRKTSEQLEDEIAELVESEVEPEAGRYMLVDNWTSEDMRPAHDFEVKQIQRKQHGIAMLELGGMGNTPARLYEVRLRDTKAPKVKMGPIPGKPGASVKSRRFYLGALVGGMLYIEHQRSYRTLEQALADVKPREWDRYNSVVVDLQEVVGASGSGELRYVLHSIIDGQILDHDYGDRHGLGARGRPRPQ